MSHLIQETTKTANPYIPSPLAPETISENDDLKDFLSFMALSDPDSTPLRSDSSLAKDSSDSERIWTPTPARPNTPTTSESDKEDFLNNPIQQTQAKTELSTKLILLQESPDQNSNAPQKTSEASPSSNESESSAQKPINIRSVIKKTAQASGVSLTEEEISKVAEAFTSYISSHSTEEVLKLIENSTWIDCGTQKVWKLNKKLGSGERGDVLLGMTSEGKKCAIKNRQSKEELEIAQSHTKQEMRSEEFYLERLQDIPGVIKLLAKNSEYLVLEYCPGNLDKEISNIYTFIEDEGETYTDTDWARLDLLTQQICGTLSKIHESGVIHGDLKKDNILIDEEGNIKISDFGSAGLSGEKIYGGSMEFMSPEQVNPNIRDKLTQKSDVWSIMFVILDLNYNVLEEYFKTQLNEYNALTSSFLQGAKSRAGDDFLGLTRDYLMQADYQFKTWQAEGRKSLFTHQPTNALEEIAIRTFSFNEDGRFSSGEIQAKIEELDRKEESLYTPY